MILISFLKAMDTIIHLEIEQCFGFSIGQVTMQHRGTYIFSDMYSFTATAKPKTVTLTLNHSL